MYKINPSKYMGVTVLPSEIAEKHLILSSAAQLKVIVYAFSKSGCLFSPEDISAGTGIGIDEVTDSLTYWAELGFILSENTSPEAVSNNTEKSEAEYSEDTPAISVPKKKEKVPHNNPTKLNYNEICIRIGESESVRILLNEAQLRLGRTIGTGDQSSLILLHDYYGLPVEVILAICEFAATRGKASNMNYIYKIGVDWSLREIDTLERADEELKSIEKTNSVWAAFSAQAKLPSSHLTSAQEKYFSQWTSEWGFSVPVLVAAFEEMKNNTEKTSFQYMHRILSEWHRKGIKTLEEVDRQREEFLREKERRSLEKSKNKTEKAKKEIVPDPNASYDILRAEERARTTVPKLKKRQ